MDIYRIISLVALALCAAMLLSQLYRLISAGLPKDYSKPSGTIKDGVIYSFTGAMSPYEKESAYLHLPTYVLGLIFHLGTFLSILIYPFILLAPELVLSFTIISFIAGCAMAIGSISGLAILIKRVVKIDLRYLSSADDYISNILTTISQAISAIVLLTGRGYAIYFILFSLFLLWIPVGKTRHVLYFFFARYHIGAFYGRRGTWPQKKTSNE